MRSLLLSLAALFSLLNSLVSATALTYRMTPNEKSCFYAWVEEKGVKVAFYFAVRTSYHFKERTQAQAMHARITNKSALNPRNQRNPKT